MSWDLEKQIRRDLVGLAGYKPIEPPEVLANSVAIPADQIIKLDGNENPYGCSPRVQKALSEYRSYHIYPDPEQRQIRKAIAAYAGVTPEHVLAGAGSDELIDVIIRLFVNPGDRVVNCPPTFGMYSFLTEVCGGEVVRVLRKSDFSLDVGAIQRSVDKHTKIIFLDSPNNPSGKAITPDELTPLLEMPLVVTVDEAYREFSKTSILALTEKYPNLFVLRTFSKWAGLAGLRLGFGIFPKEVTSLLIRIKQPYNVNAAAEVAVLESLKDIDYLKKKVALILEERARLYGLLSEIRCLQPYPSEANFILCRVRGKSAVEIHGQLRQRGIFIRHFDTDLLKDCLRFSIGTADNTKSLITALKEIC
jgi:histidinol-phosphate aminotransferase